MVSLAQVGQGKSNEGDPAGPAAGGAEPHSMALLAPWPGDARCLAWSAAALAATLAFTRPRTLPMPSSCGQLGTRFRLVNF